MAHGTCLADLERNGVSYLVESPVFSVIESSTTLSGMWPRNFPSCKSEPWNWMSNGQEGGVGSWRLGSLIDLLELSLADSGG